MAELGKVKWFNDTKGYGFIVRERGADVFVHHASIIAEGFRTLNEGDQVSFEVVEGPKGMHASNVVRIDPPKSDLHLTDSLLQKLAKCGDSAKSIVELLGLSVSELTHALLHFKFTEDEQKDLTALLKAAREKMESEAKATTKVGYNRISYSQPIPAFQRGGHLDAAQLWKRVKWHGG
jgi:CspA family cold shock protein